ncbi:MAG: hypothetical protein Q8761_03375, partial [Sweet potato little leaf phytoplasma]|nr:hypothetical protein [Sweet potato little leaf phytoplasma]
RVFIDKSYYQKFDILYQPKVNIFFIKYIFSSLKTYNSILYSNLHPHMLLTKKTTFNRPFF